MPKRIIKKIEAITAKKGKKDKNKNSKRKKNGKKKGIKIQARLGNIKKQAYLIKQERLLKKRKKNAEKQLSNFARERKSVKGDYKSRFPIFGRGKDEDAQEVTHYESRLIREHQLEMEIEKIQKALDRIKNNKYGICESCGREISRKRLKIYPEATYCMKCKNKLGKQ
jgi:RNA polymerase-binding transcription factor DksA